MITRIHFTDEGFDGPWVPWMLKGARRTGRTLELYSDRWHVKTEGELVSVMELATERKWLWPWRIIQCVEIDNGRR